MSAFAIRAVNVGKRYRVARQSNRTDLRDSFARLISNALLSSIHAKHFSYPPHRVPRSLHDYWPLRHLSFEFECGSIVGILGNNGGGKTTLLRILSRISHPTEGYLEVRGRLAALLDGFAGFHSELTGRDNIFLLGRILGTTTTENARKFEAIAAFAELEDFLDTPLKFYSTGMCSRLAFSIAVHSDADILLVDEVLSVADVDYRRKSLEKMASLRKTRRTVLFVSHDLELVRRLCTHALVLNEGRLAYFGAAHGAVDYYASSVGANETLPIRSRLVRAVRS